MREGGDRVKGLANGILVVASLSLVVGLISRLKVAPIAGIEAQAFLQFAQTLLLASIALSVMKK